MKNLDKVNKHRQAVRTIMSGISFGWSKQDIIDRIVEEFGYSEKTALYKLYVEANKLLESKMIYKAEELARRNLERLECVIEEAYDRGDNKLILNAIDLQNKTCGLYNTNVTLKNGTNENDKFIIKLLDE